LSTYYYFYYRRNNNGTTLEKEASTSAQQTTKTNRKSAGYHILNELVVVGMRLSVRNKADQSYYLYVKKGWRGLKIINGYIIYILQAIIIIQNCKSVCF